LAILDGAFADHLQPLETGEFAELAAQFLVEEFAHAMAAFAGELLAAPHARLEAGGVQPDRGHQTRHASSVAKADKSGRCASASACAAWLAACRSCSSMNRSNSASL